MKLQIWSVAVLAALACGCEKQPSNQGSNGAAAPVAKSQPVEAPKTETPMPATSGPVVERDVTGANRSEPPPKPAEEPDDAPALINALLELSKWSTQLRKALPEKFELPAKGRAATPLTGHNFHTDAARIRGSPFAERPEENDFIRLCEASYAGDVPAMKEAFASYGARLNDANPGWPEVLHAQRDMNGWKPPHYAAYRGHSAALQFLIQRGWSMGEGTGVTRKGDGKLLPALNIDRHATPLHLAVMMGHTGCVRVLVGVEKTEISLEDVAYQEVGSAPPLNVRDAEGFTPLDYAYLLNKAEIVKVLVAAGGSGRLEPTEPDATNFVGKLRFRK